MKKIFSKKLLFFQNWHVTKNQICFCNSKLCNYVVNGKQLVIASLSHDQPPPAPKHKEQQDGNKHFVNFGSVLLIEPIH